MMSRIDALRVVHTYTEKIPVVSACGATSREWALLGRRPNHLYVVDTMGFSPSIALGVSLAIKDSPVKKCIALEGDGGVLMNPNALASAAYLDAEKWLLIALDNECFASTGGQRSLSGKINIGSVAEGFGLKVYTVDNTRDLQTALESAIEEKRPVMIHTKISQHNEPGAPFINDDPAVAAFQFSQSVSQLMGKA
jgi:sulfopyruvate decarboxylase subunit beta